MKKKIVCILSLVAGVALISLAADPAGGKGGEGDTVRELRAQVAELRAEVDKLHQRTQTLEAKVEAMKGSPAPAPSPVVMPYNSNGRSKFYFTPSNSPARAPTVWGQREVNGWTYYVVPCEQQSR
jgi:hypothetical protein